MYPPVGRHASKGGLHILGGDPTRNKVLLVRDIVVDHLLVLLLLSLFLPPDAV
jgi:hypothetical protein